MENFMFFRLEIKLLREMLGTCSEASIYSKHVLNQAKEQIRKANAMQKKLTKELEKFKGSEITAAKELAELQAIVRRYEEFVGVKNEMPEDVEELMLYAKQLEAEFDEMLKKEGQLKSTFFMRRDGKPVVSTHMILGNLKENLRIIVNNSPKETKVVKSKVAVGEMMALDCKAVEEFMFPDQDVARDLDGKPLILVRPLRFEDNFGKTITALSASETLPPGTEMTCHLRVRKESPIAGLLPMLLDMGKSNGLGAWRGSGAKGQYCFKLTPVEKDPTVLPSGWC